MEKTENKPWRQQGAMDNISQQTQKLEIDKNGFVFVITHDDVDDSLLDDPVVQSLTEGLGINIGPFICGVAEVRWELKPYQYYRTEVGYPAWEHESIAFAVIDENGKFLVKFHYTDYVGRAEMIQYAQQLKRKTIIESVKFASKDFFVFNEDCDCFVQNNDVDWFNIFDIIKNNPTMEFCYIVSIPESLRFEIPEPGKMCAVYEKSSDAIRVYADTGKSRESVSESVLSGEGNNIEASGDDDSGDFKPKTIHLSRACYETESLEGLRDRDGNWLEELHLTWS